MKAWYASKTVWSGIVAALAGVLGMLGYTVTPADQATLADLALSIGSAVGGIGAIIGRVKARDGIKGGKSAGVGGVILAALVSSGLLSYSQETEAQDLQELGYLEWTIPTSRENGDPLPVEEIGGYEIRYTVDGEQYETIVPDGSANGYDVAALEPTPPPGSTTFTLGAYDTKGLYSEFVEVEVMIPGARPGPLELRYVPPSGTDPTEACVEDETCRTDMLSARYPPD